MRPTWLPTSLQALGSLERPKQTDNPLLTYSLEFLIVLENPGAKETALCAGLGEAGLFSLADKDQEMPCVPLTNPYTSGWVTATLGEETF